MLRGPPRRTHARVVWVWGSPPPTSPRASLPRPRPGTDTRCGAPPLLARAALYFRSLPLLHCRQQRAPPPPPPSCPKTHKHQRSTAHQWPPISSLLDESSLVCPPLCCTAPTLTPGPANSIYCLFVALESALDLRFPPPPFTIHPLRSSFIHTTALARPSPPISSRSTTLFASCGGYRRDFVRRTPRSG
jgi:hypothetical protein